MRGILKKIFARRPEDPFLTLIAVAREDPVIRDRMIRILNHEPFQRQLILNRWMNELQDQQAPKTFTDAIGFLLDDAIAERALQLLEQKK